MRNLALAALLATSGAALAQKPNMQEGLWETTVKMEMPGMPGGMLPQVVRQCYTARDVADPSRTVPQQKDKDNSCEVYDLKATGNTTTWSMRCKPPQEMSGTGTMTYSGGSYAGTIRMNMKQDGQAMTMVQHVTGRRVGPCP